MEEVQPSFFEGKGVSRMNGLEIDSVGYPIISEEEVKRAVKAWGTEPSRLEGIDEEGRGAKPVNKTIRDKKLIGRDANSFFASE